MAGNRLVPITLAAALVVFCVVQDRVTAAGARRYVVLQRAALERPVQGRPAVTIDEVMRPAVEASVTRGAMAAGVVAAAGLAAGAFRARRRAPRG